MDLKQGTKAMDQEQVVMGIIINAGQARSLYFEALKQAKKGDLKGAGEKMIEAQGYVSEAHKVQTQLIEEDEGEGKVSMTLIMVHAQDHLMTAMLAGELIRELIDVYRQLKVKHTDD
ncbi:MAG: PTS system N,N'-diacetylchitobiose-specific EIIA component [Candidatus Celerinatantimonas neptuna]|nr:MAG: PTS system N,N'-diacetylchitobiose-specific EIIA component [Candidatus Celerinatantimonas neptuna]